MATNRLYFGDCLDVMREDIPDESVDLIYLDPPFNSKRLYNAFIGGAQWVAFNDTWRWHEAVDDFHDVARDVRLSDSIEGLRKILGETPEMAYLSYMANRLRECRRVLKSNGSIYLHSDPTMNHYLKVVMDSVFAVRNFRSESSGNVATPTTAHGATPQPRRGMAQKPKEVPMRALFAALATALLLFMVGCKTNLTVELYSTDLASVAASTDEKLAARVVMAIQIPSASECAKYTPKVVEIMAGVVKDFTPKGCTSEQMNAYLLGEVQAPMVASNAAWKATDTLFGVIVRPKWIWLAMDRDKFKAVNDRMRKQFHQTLKVGESTVTVVLHNDGRKTEKYAVVTALVDDTPVVPVGNFELKRRARAEVKLSNVASRYLAKHGNVPMFMPVKEEGEGN